MKRFLILLPAAALCFASCTLPESSFEYYGVQAFCDVVSGNLSISSGTTTLIVSQDMTDGGWKNLPTVFCTFDMSGTGVSESYAISLLSYVPVVTNSAVHSGISDPETLGTDPVGLFQDWGYDSSRKRLNLAVQYVIEKDSETEHDITLVVDDEKSDASTIYFTLRHNAHGDAPVDGEMISRDYETVCRYCGFDLSAILPSGSASSVQAVIGWDWYINSSDYESGITHHEISGRIYLNQ